MNSLESFLDEREEHSEKAEAEAPKAKVDWMLAGPKAKPEERLIAFDHWVCEQLEKRLVWTQGDATKERRIFQCRVELEHMLTQLYSRGWLLDGKRLANHVTTVLDAVGKAQRAGQVKDFWPYFKAAVSRYVGANSEEIQAESRRAGNMMGNLLGALGVTRGGTMTELIATRRSEIVEEKTLREKLATARKSSKRDNSQLPLL